jgi:tetratricopeptide (TPR) repeat protein
MRLVKAGRVIDDPFVRVLDDAPLPEGVPILLPAARYLADELELASRMAPTGILWPNNRKISELAPYLDRLALIGLIFPNFRDGRAYSQARQLRENFGFRGELRATAGEERVGSDHQRRARQQRRQQQAVLHRGHRSDAGGQIDLPRAEEAFRKATEQNPWNEGAAIGLGTTLSRLGRKNDAARALADAAGRFPRSAKAAEALGDVLFDAGRFLESADAYRRAVGLGRSELAAREREARARSAGP